MVGRGLVGGEAKTRFREDFGWFIVGFLECFVGLEFDFVEVLASQIRKKKKKKKKKKLKSKKCLLKKEERVPDSFAQCSVLGETLTKHTFH